MHTGGNQGSGRSLSEAGSANVSTISILSQVILCYWDCPVHYRIFNNTPGLSQQNISTVQLRQPKMSPGSARCHPGRLSHHLVRSTGLLSARWSLAEVGFETRCVTRRARHCFLMAPPSFRMTMKQGRHLTP